VTALVRLYPQAWRDRYEAEFLGILEARPPSGRDRLDIVRGALDARLHPEIAGRPDAPVPTMDAARLAGGAAIVSGVAVLAWTGLVLRDFKGWDSPPPENAWLLALLSAVAFLSLTAAHVLLAMAGESSMRRAGGLGASIAAVSYFLAAFGAGTTIVFGLIGSVVLFGAQAARTIPAWLSAIVIGTSVFLFAAMLRFTSSDGQHVGLFAFGVPFGVAWIVLGVVVIRRGVPSRTTVPDAVG
jgi:hypothetical protein